MKVVISAEEHAKIMHIVRSCSKEVSGLGLVKNVNGTLYVTKMYLLEQEVTCVETELNDQAIANQMYQAIQDREHGTLNFWWHSHVNMGVFWSGTDKATKEKISKNGWFLSTVFNKKGEMKSCFNQGASDYYPSLEIDDLQTSVEFILAPSVLAGIEAEIKAKVKEPVAKHWYGNGKTGIPQMHTGYEGSSWSDGWDDADVPYAHKHKSFWEEEYDTPFAARAGYNNRAFNMAEQRRAERELKKAERRAKQQAKQVPVYTTPNGEQIITAENLITRENGWNVVETIENGCKVITGRPL